MSRPPKLRTLGRLVAEWVDGTPGQQAAARDITSDFEQPIEALAAELVDAGLTGDAHGCDCADYCAKGADCDQ